MNKNALKYLRGFSHDIHPIVMVADKGLTENVMNEIELALDRHELVKIKLRTDRETRAKYIEEIIQKTNSVKIQSIGQTLTIFRANPKNPQFELPKK